uniref:Uncharacterized protein n=1 Tax=Panagrolaimus sp. PS1159 TaxID=55785 RepID=A0AC35GCS5_9BILA
MLRFATKSSALRYTSYRGYQSTNLKEVLAKKIPEHNKKVVEFRKAYGGTIIQEITIDMVYG